MDFCFILFDLLYWGVDDGLSRIIDNNGKT